MEKDFRTEIKTEVETKIERDIKKVPSSEPLSSRDSNITRSKIGAVLEPSFQLETSNELLQKRLAGAAVEAPTLRKSLPIDDLELSGRTDLLFLWEDVMSDYLDRARHELFVNACLQAQALTYAAKKYAQILEAAPTEEIANDMRRRIRGFAGVHLEGASPVVQMETWKIPLPSFNSFILFLGAILVVVGMGLPHMRDIAKLGAAMIALAIGLRVYMRRPA